MRRGRANFARRHKLGIASVVVVALVLSGLAAFILATPGSPARDARLNDGSVWVSANTTTGTDGLPAQFGQMNVEANQFSKVLTPASANSLDIYQLGSAVLGYDTGAQTLTPINPVLQQLDTGDALKLGQAVPYLGGDDSAGTLAVVDPSTGGLWATPVSASTPLGQISGVDPTSKALAHVGANAAVAVDRAGSVHAVSAAVGITTVTAGPGGWRASNSKLPSGLAGALTITTVGTAPVIMAAAPGSDSPTLLLPDGQIKQLHHVGQGAVLQQPGPSGNDVLVETTTMLIAVSLASGASRTIATGSGTSVAPVYFGRCEFAAWGGSAPSELRACGGVAGAPVGLPSVGGANSLVFRVNHQHLLLQDRDSGQVWNDEAGTPVQIADWQAVQPPRQSKGNTRQNAPGQNDHTKAAAAVADNLGARPGRTTVLHVLDNDKTPAGTVLTVNEVLPPTSVQATVAVAPDRQSVMVTLPATATGQFTFQYDDANGGSKVSNKATVTVTIVPDGTYFTPTLRYGTTSEPGYQVATNGTVTIPVLNDWRVYPDGDPPALAELTAASVHAAGATAIVTPDGAITYQAGKDSGSDTIRYSVVNGDKSATATLAITIVGSSGKPAKPTAENDFVRVTVGQPITFAPLANDLPGVDPLEPSAQLHIAGAIKAPSGLTVDLPDANDNITIAASQPGQYKLKYADSFGSINSSPAIIQVQAVAPDPHATVQAGSSSVTVRGTVPALVDPTLNDTSSSGGLLTVIGASSRPASDLDVAVVRGRWLRVDRRQPVQQPTTDVFSYQVTDGSTVATGQVTVVEMPRMELDTPVAVTDYADVRAGDSVTIPVLDNDLDPAGDTLSLAARQPRAPGAGQLSVTPGTPGQPTGSAFAAGGAVRYVAPPPGKAVTSEQTVTIMYAAENTTGQTVTGVAVVTIHPRGDIKSDQPPTPRELDARVVAGGTVTIPVPTSGVDPDGDTVQVQGLALPQGGDPQPRLGALIAYTANSLTYQAYPSATNAGTDVFTYQVADTYGLSARATVRVAVVQPTTLPAPVAHTFAVTASPGSVQDIHVVTPAHVDYPEGAAPLLLDPVGTARDGHSIAALIAKQPGWLRVHVPQSVPGNVATVNFTVRSDLGAHSTASILITLVPGYDPAPIAVDEFAKPKAKATDVVVNLLAGAYSPGHSPLVVKSPSAAVNGKLTVALTGRPQVIPFVIVDGAGAEATAVAYIPAAGADSTPYWNGRPITIGEAKATTEHLGDHVTDPQGAPLQLTVQSQIWASPAPGLSARITGTTTFELKGAPGYQGPASVTFAVTRTKNINQYTLITVPVIVGNPDPVLRCPTDAVPVEAGLAAGERISPVSQCHVWTPPTLSPSSLTFHATWKGSSLVHVTTNDSGTLVIKADHDAKPQSTGTLVIGVNGHRGAKTATLRVVVVPAPQLTVAPISVQGILTTGAPTVINLGSYVNSPFGSSAVSIVKLGSIPGVSISHTARTITVKATNRTLSGVRQLGFVVTDLSNRNDSSRWQPGNIALQFIGVPGIPTALTPRTTWGQDHQLLVTWSPPADNGATIDQYKLTWAGGTQLCPAGTSCVITGLVNSHHYQFQIQAHNLAGWGAISGRSPVGIPDVKPGQIQNFKAIDPQNHQLTLTWTPQGGDAGSVGFQYVLTWTGSVSGSWTTTNRSLGTHTVNDPNLDNDQPEKFAIYAVNEAGAGPVTPTSGESAGAPSAPTFDAGGAFKPEPDATGNYVLTVTWQPVDRNGLGPVTYTVSRDQGVVLGTTQSTSWSDSGFKSDGSYHTYTVVAKNAYHSGPPATSQQVEWTQPPDQMAAPVLAAVQPGDPDGQVTVHFTTVPSHGNTLTVHCNYTINGTAPTESSPTCPGSASWPTYSRDGGTSDSKTLSGLNPGQESVPVQVIMWEDNGSTQNTSYKDGAASPVSNSVTTNAPPSTPTAQPCGLNGDNVVYSWTAATGTNGRTITYQLTGDANTTTPNPSWQVAHFEDFQSHTLDVTAVDSYGDKSSPVLSVTCPDKAPPPPPPVSNLKCSNGTTITWTWSNPTPPNGNVQYHLALSNAINNGNYWNTSASISPGQTGQNYTLTVTVYDNDPNGNQASSPQSATCSSPSSGTVTLAWAGKAPASLCGGDTSCTYFTISWANFSPGGHTLTPYFDGGGNWCGGQPGCSNSQSVSGSSGTFGNYYASGYCAQQHAVTASVDNVLSGPIYTTGHSC